MVMDGIEYQGTFVRDNIEGVGIFKWKNGDVYKGQVKFGKMHGNGIYRFKNGKEYKGMFNMGKRMNERIDSYQNWKSVNYGIPPNQIYHINRNPVTNEQSEINQINNGDNIGVDNLRANSAIQGNNIE